MGPLCTHCIFAHHSIPIARRPTTPCTADRCSILSYQLSRVMDLNGCEAVRSDEVENSELNESEKGLPTRFTNFIKLDSKKELFSWHGSLKKLQEFCVKVLNLESPIKIISGKTSTSLKTKSVTLSFYPSTRTLQVQGAQVKELKEKLKTLVGNADEEFESTSASERNANSQETNDAERNTLSSINDLNSASAFNLDSVIDLEDSRTKNSAPCCQHQSLLDEIGRIKAELKKIKDSEIFRAYSPNRFE